jgi:hypothetical protein
MGFLESCLGGLSKRLDLNRGNGTPDIEQILVGTGRTCAAACTGCPLVKEVLPPSSPKELKRQIKEVQERGNIPELVFTSLAASKRRVLGTLDGLGENTQGVWVNPGFSKDRNFLESLAKRGVGGYRVNLEAPSSTSYKRLTDKSPAHWEMKCEALEAARTVGLPTATGFIVGHPAQRHSRTDIRWMHELARDLGVSDVTLNVFGETGIEPDSTDLIRVLAGLRLQRGQYSLTVGGDWKGLPPHPLGRMAISALADRRYEGKFLTF